MKTYSVTAICLETKASFTLTIECAGIRWAIDKAASEMRDAYGMTEKLDFEIVSVVCIEK